MLGGPKLKIPEGARDDEDMASSSLPSGVKFGRQDELQEPPDEERLSLPVFPFVQHTSRSPAPP